MKFATSYSALRPVIAGTLAVCVVIAMAPWWTGGQEPLGMLLSGSALLLAVLLAWRQPRVRSVLGGPLLWLYAALLAWASLSWCWSANRYSTVVWVTVLAMMGLAFRLAYLLGGEGRAREWLVRGYILSAAGAAGYGLWLYVTESYDRLTGPFYWPNPMAGYLIPGLIIGVDRVVHGGRGRRIWTIVVAVLGGVFALTDSRAATLILVIMLAVFLWRRGVSMRQWVYLLFGGVLAVALTMSAMSLRHIVQPNVDSTTLGGRFAEAAAGQAHSASDRIYYVRSALAMLRDHPWLGVGAGTYGDVHPQYQGRVVSAATNAHNFYVQSAAELGMVGIILLSGLAAVLLWGMWQGVKRGHDDQLALALGALGLGLHMAVDIDARYPAIMLLWAVLMGLVYWQYRSYYRPLSWWPVGLVAVVMLPLISLHLSAGWSERARASQDSNDYQSAADQFAIAHQWPVYNPDVVNAEGINHYSEALIDSTDRRAEAALALDRARQAEGLDPHDGQHYELEGRVRLLQGDLAGASTAFRQALRLDPYNHPEYAYDLGLVLRREGHSDEAMKVAHAMADQYTDAVLNNRWADTGVRPSVAGLWVLIGEIELNEHHWKQAQAAAERAMAVYPENPYARPLRETAISEARAGK